MWKIKSFKIGSNWDTVSRHVALADSNWGNFLYYAFMDTKELPHSRVNQPQEDDPIFFYPKEFYVFDNFSSFQVEYDGCLWATSEHAYQAQRFKETAPEIFEKIKVARSAHDAQKIASENKSVQNPNWDNIKKDVMKEILRCKINQHSYVLKKLLQSGSRIIIEDSWRDSTWGWGANKDGKNLLGKIWMELRDEYKNKSYCDINSLCLCSLSTS